MHSNEYLVIDQTDVFEIFSSAERHRSGLADRLIRLDRASNDDDSELFPLMNRNEFDATAAAGQFSNKKLNLLVVNFSNCSPDCSS